MSHVQLCRATRVSWQSCMCDMGLTRVWCSERRCPWVLVWRSSHDATLSSVCTRLSQTYNKAIGDGRFHTGCAI